MMASHDAHPAFVGKRTGNNDKKLVTTTKRGRGIARARFLYSNTNLANATEALDGKPPEYI